MRKAGSQKAFVRHIVEPKDRKFHVVFTTTCHYCGQEGTMTYPMDHQKRLHQEELSRICSGCADRVLENGSDHKQMYLLPELLD